MTDKQARNCERILRAARGWRFYIRTNRGWHEIGPINWHANRRAIRHLDYVETLGWDISLARVRDRVGPFAYGGEIN